MSLADIISRFSTAGQDGSPGGYVVTRRAAGSFDTHGVWTGGTTTTITTDARVQPYGGQLKVLPEGIREEDIRVIYSPVELKAVPTADSIVIAGQAFSVFNVDGPFTMDAVSYWRAYAAKQATT